MTNITPASLAAFWILPDNLAVTMIVEGNRSGQANSVLRVYDLHKLITWTNSFTQKMKSLGTSPNRASCDKLGNFEARSGHSEGFFLNGKGGGFLANQFWFFNMNLNINYSVKFIFLY